jgi:hypothetical protein
MLLLLACMHFWKWGSLRRWSACAPTDYEVVRYCRKFEEHCSIQLSNYMLLKRRRISTKTLYLQRDSAGKVPLMPAAILQ